MKKTTKARQGRATRAAQPAPQVSAAEATPDTATWEPRLVRLNKYLADHGVASRRRCDELIADGKVTVDGQIVRELGLKVDPARQVVETTPRGLLSTR